ncbi:MAG TPA: OB-fold nucleic acid binding domain-containing protein, partial [Ignavibacteriaceae bacterium]
MLFKRRTHTCGQLRESNIGQEVVLNGWVDTRRDLGGLIFIDLRDRYGITQVVFEPSFDKDAHRLAGKLRSEFVISVEGTVRKRPLETDNAKIPTGHIDVMVKKIVILNEAQTTPFPISDNVNASEDLR